MCSTRQKAGATTQLDIKRAEDGSLNLDGSNAAKATVKNVVKGAFSDTVTLTLTEPVKEGTNVEVIPHNGKATKGTYLGRTKLPVTNEKPTLASKNGQTETTVNVGDNVNPASLVTVADHEDDKDATLGTKSTC